MPGALMSFVNLHIARTAIEEGFHRIDISVLLHHDALEGDGRNLQVTGHLRIHHILAPGNALVRTAIHHFRYGRSSAEAEQLPE